jgi:hypothetical protein
MCSASWTLHGQQQTKLPYDKENVFFSILSTSPSSHPDPPGIVMRHATSFLFCLIDLFLQEDSGIVVVVVDSFDLCVLSTLLFWEGKKKKE